MTPTPQHVEGWELAMEYMTLAASGADEEASDCIRRAFDDPATAAAFAVSISNFANALVHSSAQTFGVTPSDFWVHCATRLQAHRPPEWER